MYVYEAQRWNYDKNDDSFTFCKSAFFVSFDLAKAWCEHDAGHTTEDAPMMFFEGILINERTANLLPSAGRSHVTPVFNDKSNQSKGFRFVILKHDLLTAAPKLTVAPKRKSPGDPLHRHTGGYTV